MGQEHKGPLRLYILSGCINTCAGKGVNLALGPMMNMGRVAEGGRNWEGFGADPFFDWRILRWAK